MEIEKAWDLLDQCAKDDEEHDAYDLIRADWKRLQTDVDEYDVTLKTLSRLLTGVAHAIKGEPDELTLHSWHDLPELTTALVAKRLKLAAENAGLRIEWEEAVAIIEVTHVDAQPLTHLMVATYELFKSLDSRPAIDAKGCRCASCQKLYECRRIRAEVNSE